MPVAIKLIDKNGREWVAGSAIEVNDLLAQGYRVKGHADGEPTPTPAPQKNNPTSDGGSTK